MTADTRHSVWLRATALIRLLFAGVVFVGLAGCGSHGARQTTDASARAAPTDSLRLVDVPVDSAAPPVGKDVAGYPMDRQAAELATIDGANTTRVDDGIKIILDSELLFGFDSAMLKIDAQEYVERMAGIFQRYPDTRIVISGHTDSQGDEDYNFTLSERRALSVRNCLIDAGVPPARIETVGYGEFRPLAPNDTEEGRRINRRVEIEIHPAAAIEINNPD